MARSKSAAVVATKPPAVTPRVTMWDVANRAGVSQTLVSLVIGGSPTARVAEATRKRVLAAAAELGYRPNVIAQALVRRRSYAIGLIIPDLHNLFFADVVSGAERVATELGYAVLFCHAAEVSTARHLDALRARQIDGVILDAIGAASLDEGALHDLNVVLIDQPNDVVLGVASDAPGAGRQAAEHLLTLGHRHVGYLGPATDVWSFRMRERGFTQAVRAAGFMVRSEDLVRAPASVEGGERAMQRVLDQVTPPTAVFCANDLMALGALRACAVAGIAVPARISVVGCDDIETARLVTPQLTTVAVPAREMGARAARLLLQMLDGETVRPTKPLPVRLVIRGTTAAPTRARRREGNP